MKQHESVEDLGRMQRYQRAVTAGTGSADLAKRIYDHCRTHHRFNGMATGLRWPEPAGVVVSEPNYFAFNNIGLTACSVGVDVFPVGRADYCPAVLSEEEAQIIALKDSVRTTGRYAGEPARLRFRVTRADQLGLAYRLLDHAHRLRCRQLAGVNV